MMASWEERSITLGDGMEDGGIADRAPIDKQFLGRAPGSGVDRINGESAYLGDGNRVRNRQDLVQKPGAIDLPDTVLLRRHRGIIQHLVRVMGQPEMNRRPSQGRLLDHTADVRELRRDRLEEFLT